MNKFEQFLATKSLNLTQFKALEVEKQADIQNEYLGYLESLIDKSMTKEQVTAEIEAQRETLKEFLGKEIAGQLAEQSKGDATMKTLHEQLIEAISEKADEIKETAKNGKFVEIELKAVASVTTGSGTYPATPPALSGSQQAPLQNVNLRGVDVLGLTTNFNTGLASYPYTEAEPKEGGFDYVAEGGTKPQIDLKWSTRYANPVKVAAWMKLTEEAVQDVANLQSVATDFLLKQHNLKKARGILFGDGTSPNPKGATVYGRAFSAGALATSVTNPNFMDVVNACITDIYTTHNFTDEMPYMANIVMVNPNDFFINLVSAKDGNGLPLFPTASLFNQVVIGGVTIIPDEMIPAGKIFVADMSKYNTTNYLPYTVKIGWVNDDFIKNQFVILGESRFHAFVKKLDEQAFIYDDIATIKTAIDIANA